MAHSWMSSNNNFHSDFEIYPTHEDALAGASAEC